MDDEAALWARVEEGNAAFRAEDMQEAARIYAEVSARLRPEHDAMAPEVYENLGLAYVFAGRPKAAVPCFLRALDGEPTCRQQSLQWLIVSLLQDERVMDAVPLMRIYEATFGVHPEGWRVADLERADVGVRRRVGRSVPC